MATVDKTPPPAVGADLHETVGPDRATTMDLAAWSLAAAALTSTWGGTSVVGSVRAYDILLLFALACVWFDIVVTPLLLPPRWVAAVAFAIPAVAMVQTMFPTSTTYLTQRLDLSDVSSVSRGSEIGSPIGTAAQWLFAAVLIPMLVTAVARRRGQYVVRIGVAWASGAAVSGLVALTDSFGVTAVGTALLDFSSNTGRQSGLASHPVNLGVAAAMATPIAIYVLTRKRFAGFFLVGLLAAAAFLSGSRGAQAGFVIAIVLSVLFTRPARRTFHRIVAAVLVLGSLSYVYLPESMERLLRFVPGQSRDATASDEGRERLAAQAVQDWLARPLDGIGLGYATQAHSIYLQVAAAGGIVLVVAFGMYFGGALRSGWRLRVDERVPIGGFLLASTATWLVVGVSQNQLLDRYLYVPVACLAALAAWRTAADYPGDRSDSIHWILSTAQHAQRRRHL